MAYYDEDDAIVDRLIQNGERDFLATLVATLADYHANPSDLSAVIANAAECARLRREESEIAALGNPAPTIWEAAA